jgi:hypothetical protein
MSGYWAGIMLLRPLGFAETCCAIVQEFGSSGAIRFMAIIEGPCDAETVQTGIGIMRQRHPMMNASLELRDQRYWFSPVDSSRPTPLVIASRAAADHPDTQFRFLADHRFVNGDLLYKFVFVHDPAGRQHVLLGLFSHTMADGLSTYEFLAHFGVILDRLIGGQRLDDAETFKSYEFPPSQEKLLQPGRGVTKFFSFAAKELLALPKPYAPRHANVSCDGQGGPSLISALGAQELHRLMLRARSKHLGMLDLCAGALLQLQQELQEEEYGSIPSRSTARLLTWMDARRRALPSRCDMLTLGARPVPFDVRIRGRIDLDQGAHAFRALLVRHDRSFVRDTLNYHHDGLLRNALSRRAARERRFRSGMGVTHVGHINKLTLRHISLWRFGNISLKDGSNMLNLMITVVDGTSILSFNYSAFHLSKSRARALVYRFHRILGVNEPRLFDGYLALRNEWKTSDAAPARTHGTMSPPP